MLWSRAKYFAYFQESKSSAVACHFQELASYVLHVTHSAIDFMLGCTPLPHIPRASNPQNFWNILPYSQSMFIKLAAKPKQVAGALPQMHDLSSFP